MAKIASDVTELIGGTPLLELQKTEAAEGLCARLLVKLESKNPGGSAKDRVARAMVLDAEASGALKPGGTILEPTSGNTGIGLAAVCAARGYRLILTMPETMSVERQRLARAYGAEIVLTPGKDGMTGAIREAERLHEAIPGSLIAGQFTNPANPKAHYDTTGPEIWADTDGKIDAFVAGVGTGGTITGTGRYLKEQNPAIRVVAVEPAGSAVLSGKPAGAHKLQGIGAGFIPAVLDTSVYDAVVPVTDGDAMETARQLGRREGVLCGISGGAALFAAIALCKSPDMAGKTVVALLPDTGERYLSTELFAESAE